MLPYIFHVSILIATCYLFYRILWEKETFFQLNRWILITCLLLSFGLPWLPIPSSWSLQNKVVQQKILPTSVSDFPNTAFVSPDNQSVESNHVDVIESEAESGLANEVTEDLSNSTLPPTEKPSSNQWSLKLNIWQILQYTYLAGLIIFALNFLIQLALIFFQKATNPHLQDGRYTIVEINQDKAPFSFGNSIFINPTKYDWDTFNQILAHEKIHIEQRHTIDILLAELVVIVQWFNPFAWLYRKAVENNLEYLTDDKMLHLGTERAAYQLNLLRVSVPQLPLNLTTNYNQSFLKKRIAMMNVKKSSASSSWKYLMLLPLLAMTVIALNPVQLEAQTPTKKEEKKPSSWWQTTPKPPAPPSPPTPPMPPGTPPNPPVPPAPPVPGMPPAPPTPPNVSSKTTMIGDWTINANQTETVNGEVIMEENQGLHISGAVSFDDEDIIVHKGTVTIDGAAYRFTTTGDWTGKFDGNELCLQLSSGDKVKDYSFYVSFCDRDFGTSVYPNAKGPFKLPRAAGILTLNGDFNGKKGMGEYSFVEDANLRQFLASEGYSYVTENLMFHLYISEIGKDFFTFLKKEGYANLPQDELEQLVYHRLSKEKLEEYFKAFNKLKFDKPTMHELVQLAIHDIEPSYIEKLGGELFKDLTIQEIVEAAIHNVNPEYIKDMRALGYDDLSFREIIEFSIHDIDADYVKALKDSGLNLNKREIVEAAIHHIDVDRLAEFSKLGLDNLSFREIIELNIHDVDADYVKALRALGYGKTSTRELIDARIHDINPDNIKAYNALGFKNIPIQKLVELHIHDVTPSFIEKVQNSGTFKDLSLDEYIEMKIHGTDRKMRQRQE